MDCPIDSAQLIDYFLEPTIDAARAAHIQQCENCQRRLAALFKTAFEPADALNCQEAEPILLSWLENIENQLTEASNLTRENAEEITLNQDALQHIKTCPACQQTIQEWKVISAAIVDGTLRQPNLNIAPDLSFLQPVAQKQTMWNEQIDQAVKQGAYWLINQAGELWVNLQQYIQLQPTLAPLPVKAGKLRHEPILQLTFTPQPDLNLELVAWPDLEKQDQINVEVVVRRPSQFWDGFGGTKIVLYGPKETRQATTDIEGRVRFAGVRRDELPQLTFSAR